MPLATDDGPAIRAMRNLRLTLAYDGTDFHGWQRQSNAATIQECLESAIEKIISERVVVYGSGRTDAGVHASNQVANFKAHCRIPRENLLKALNDLLPTTVRVKDAREVSQTFHARYDVRSKTYRYRILQTPICSPFVGRFVWHYPYPLERKRIAEAARLLEGEHDFASFAGSAWEGLYGPPEKRERQALPYPTEHLASEDNEVLFPDFTPESRPPNLESRSMIRTIFSSRILWRARSQILVYEVRGNGFLHHMVRNIVGTLVEVGNGRVAPQDMTTILEARDRRRAGPTAPAQGLCLVRVEY